MIPNLYLGNGCFTKHPLKNGCLGFQADLLVVNKQFFGKKAAGNPGGKKTCSNSSSSSSVARSRAREVQPSASTKTTRNNCPLNYSPLLSDKKSQTKGVIMSMINHECYE